MRITVLAVPECPNATLAMARVTAALAGRPADVELVEIHDEDEAAERGMTGSPTILVDGVDPFAQAGSVPSLSCRLYRDADGTVAGVPSPAALRAALESRTDGGSTVMTIGTLARRTGVPVKALREYEDAGLIYTIGRSPGNYRLFDDTALCCVDMIGTLRALGLTLAEIRKLAGVFLGQPGDPVGPQLAELLRVARARTETQIAELHHRCGRIDEFETRYATQLAGDFQRARV